MTITHDALDLTTQRTALYRTLAPLYSTPWRGPQLPCDTWWSRLETCWNLFTWEPHSPLVLISGGYWSMYGQHVCTVHILLEYFLVIRDSRESQSSFYVTVLFSTNFVLCMQAFVSEVCFISPLLSKGRVEVNLCGQHVVNHYSSFQVGKSGIFIH